MFNTGEEYRDRPVYTGLTDVNIIAVNPTLAEAEKLDLPIREEPTYISTSEEGNAKIRLDFWVKNAQVLTKIAFFLEDCTRVSSAGNKQFINNYGSTVYAVSAQDITYDWYKQEGVRECKVGEAELVDFIKAWLSVPQGGEARIDNISQLIKGDLTFLKGLITTNAARKVQILLIVKESDGKYYQNVYTRYFGRAGGKSVTYWQKHMDKAQTLPNYQNNFKLQEFNTFDVASTNTVEDTSSNPWADK